MAFSASQTATTKTRGPLRPPLSIPRFHAVTTTVSFAVCRPYRGGGEGILHGEFILDCTFGHRIRDDVLGAMDLIDGNMLVAISRFPLS